MISPAVIEAIQRLLAEGGRSQREIAKMTKVSRGTVAAVDSGMRRRDDPRPKTPGKAPAGSVHRCPEPPERLKPVKEPTEPVRRCPGCGGMVVWPCWACHVRKVAPHVSSRCDPAALDEPLRLELDEEERARYEEVRRMRIVMEG